ncbi:MAG: DUF308 domain-containing protein [Proteobacteria bacterium]|jgi:uncharacterized membrane protein HdeD (DUF308 family)|nr:DUF308 domain-containing protein [Pseudomonadota bacterium]
MNEQEYIRNELKKNWGWMLVAGIVLVVLGTIGLGMSFWLTLASMFYIGTLLLIGSGVQLVNTLKCKGGINVLWHSLITLLYLAAGIIVITEPVIAGMAMTALLAVALLGIGMFRSWIAIRSRPMKGWGFILATGLAAIGLGLMIYSGWPATGQWIIGMLVAIEIIMQGWTLVMFAIAARSA